MTIRKIDVRIAISQNGAESSLAREPEISCAMLALVTDRDGWRPDHDSVTIDLISANLVQNAATMQKIAAANRFMARRRGRGC